MFETTNQVCNVYYTVCTWIGVRSESRISWRVQWLTLKHILVIVHHSIYTLVHHPYSTNVCSESQVTQFVIWAWKSSYEFQNTKLVTIYNSLRGTLSHLDCFEYLYRCVTMCIHIYNIYIYNIYNIYIYVYVYYIYIWYIYNIILYVHTLNI